MTGEPSSPRIASVSWGRIEIAGHGSFKDAKLWPGGARAWDWDETGTRHDPGVQPADVEELLEHGAQVVVLTKGMQERLGVKPETIEALEEAGVEVKVLPTDEAARVYNDLVDRARVGGLFHTTC